MGKHTLIAVLCLFCSTSVFGITPVAKTDVVPYQRINYGESFKFGVTTFSKPGINRVEFAISGSGYTGGTKTVYSMALNDRVASEGYASEGVTNSPGYPGVWEYYCTISYNEFTSNGTINVTPTVYDNNGNSRNLGATTMIVEATSADSGRKACWVDVIGSDGVGTVGSSSDPYPSIQSAVTACQNANSGSSSGNIIYLKEYSNYDITGLSFSASGEWLMITKDATADREDVIIKNGPPSSSRLRLDNVTLQAPGGSQEILSGSSSIWWTNNCRLIGCGREITRSNPVMMDLYKLTHTGAYYSTGCYTYDVNFAYQAGVFARGAVIHKTQNDAFQNPQCIINARVDDVTNGPSTVHCDIAQFYALDATYKPVDNRLIYNVFATNAHYQGIMMNVSSPTDLAFVNVFIEMREPGESGGETYPQISPALNEVQCDHLLIWNCSFPYAHADWRSDHTNSSFIGNVFWQEISTESIPSSSEWLYNHFMHVYGLTPTCVDTSKGDDPSINWPCPHWYASIKDTGSSTATYGDGVIDISTPGASNFGYPVVGEDLINKLPSSHLTKVPADTFGNPRDSNPDVGALEYTGEDTIAPTLNAINIPASGTQTVLGFSENMQIGAGGFGGISLILSNGAVTFLNCAASGTNITCSNNRVVGSGETLVSFGYVQPGNGFEDTSTNNNDCATITSYSGSFTNNVPPAAGGTKSMITNVSGGSPVVNSLGGTKIQTQ